MVDPFTVALTWGAMAAGAVTAAKRFVGMFKKKPTKPNPVMEDLERKLKMSEQLEERYTKQIDAMREAANQALVAQLEAEKRLKKLELGLTDEPTRDQFEYMKQLRQWHPANIHFAIAGATGSGKSSLINAFRGISNNSPGVARAAVGDTETTREVTRYPMSDIRPGSPFVWYDIPGAGTRTIPSRDYFNAQGLYIFDAIIVLYDIRFTEIDLEILRRAKQRNIPTYIVRTKSDVHIQNIMRDMPGYPDDEDDEDGDEIRARFEPAARGQFEENTRRDVANNLALGRVDPQDVYIVSSRTMCALVKDPQRPLGRRRFILDEQRLLDGLTRTINARRY